MERVYIAAPIFNRQQLQVVSSITMMLKMQEWQIFSPYQASQSIWRGRAPKDCTQAERDAVLVGNITNLHWTHLLLAWVGGSEDGKTDTGVVWEMGHFDALRRYQVQDDEVAVHPRFTLAYIDPTDKRQHVNLMLAGTVDAVAYGPAQLAKAVEMLRRLPLAPTYEEDGYPYREVREKFHPDKQILHEKEPIV